MIAYILLSMIWMTTSHGLFIVTKAPAVIEVGDTVVLKCVNSSVLAASISWESHLHPDALTDCDYHTNNCFPSTSSLDSRYTFSSIVDNGEFFMTISNINTTDSGLYKCTDGSAVGTITLVVPTPTGSDPDEGFPTWAIVVIVVGGTCGGGGAVILVILHLKSKQTNGTGEDGNISNSVPIPQEDCPDIKFEEVLTHSFLNGVEQETGVKVMICGKGSSKYDQYGDPKLHSDQLLHVYITSDKPEDVRRALDWIKGTIDDYIAAAAADGPKHSS